MLLKSFDEFVSASRKGLCGNTPHIWTPKEFVRDGFGEAYVSSTSGDRRYHQTKSKVSKMISEAKVNYGFVETRCKTTGELERLTHISKFTCQESPSKKEQCYAFGGEYTHESRSLACAATVLPWGVVKRLCNTFHCEGLMSENILKRYMGDRAQHLFEVGEAWPEHVIEFTLFPWNMGIWNTRPLIWEVRAY